MKKLIVLLSICLLLMTGCSIKKLDNVDIGKNIKILLSEKVKLENVYFDGYKYYIPKGLKFINKDDYNALLTDKMNNKYYLYIDVISYYNKVENDYEIDKSVHYSNKLNYNKKTGYIQINEIKGMFFVQFVYNYAKLEAYVKKSELTSVVNNMCYILRSIKFNDTVLESLIGENVLNYQEENYNLFKADNSQEDFLDVVEQNETEAYKQAIEDEKIDLGE